METIKPSREHSVALESAIRDIDSQLIGLSHQIHGRPELGGEEVFAHSVITELLGTHGFVMDELQPSAATAFSMSQGTGRLVVTYCVEYDALPEIGHGCGHNVNGAASVGAAIALARIAESVGVTVHVLGTPAEESHGGKIDLLTEGFFGQSHVALMAHAGGEDIVGNSSLALNAWDVTFTGRAAHAAAAPELGVNALDAVNVAQYAIALARQQLPAGSIVSIMVVEGGQSVNVIPDRAKLRIEMRAPGLEQLDTVNQRIRHCVQAGALATGCILTVDQLGHTFAELHQDEALTTAYARSLAERGRVAVYDSTAVASTDMGNVSRVVPCIHPMIGYDVQGAAHHTLEFAGYGTTPQADAAVVDAAYALAAAAADLAMDPGERTRLLARRG